MGSWTIDPLGARNFGERDAMKIPFLGRGARLLAAWVVGCVIYLIAAILWSFDGIVSLVLQPVVAVIVSALCVGTVWLAGLLLRVKGIGRLWSSARGLAGALVAACLAVMVFGSAVGLTAVYTEPETGRSFLALHPVAALASYFVLLFAIAHWPGRTPAWLA